MYCQFLCGDFVKGEMVVFLVKGRYRSHIKYAYANARIEFELFALYILDKQKQKQLKSWSYKLVL